MSSDPLVYVAVLAWTHKDETIASLESLRGADYPNLRFVVADNGSTDGTAETLRERFPDVEVVRSETNVGVAGGYNLGIEHALKNGAAYVLVANNDIMVDPAMIGTLVRALECRPEAGVAMPKIYHYYGDRTRLWCAGARWRRFPPGVKMIGSGARDGPRFSTERDIDYAPSCCLLLRRAALEQVGFFDTGYFFYNDDWDFSARVREGGYRIRFVPAAKMWHKVSISTQKSDKPARWWHVMGQTTVRFYLRHATPWVCFQFTAWFVMRELIKLNFKRIPPFLAGVGHELRAMRRPSA
jgi:GT2 family glycosyltransferase